MIYDNKEQYEAAVQEADLKKHEIMLYMSDEDRLAMHAVQEATQILVDAGVPAFIFYYVDERVWNSNTLPELFNFDKKKDREELTNITIWLYGYMVMLLTEVSVAHKTQFVSYCEHAFKEYFNNTITSEE